MLDTISTENYVLRGMELADTNALYAIMSDKQTMKFITPHPVKSLEEMKKEVEESLERAKEQREIPWVILHKATLEVIGIFQFHKVNHWHKKAEMRAVIKQDYQQTGVMKEVLQTMIPYGFQELGLNRIVGDIFEGNVGSRKLLERFGFKKEGVLRETDFDGERYHHTVVYGLLKREYNDSEGAIL